MAIVVLDPRVNPEAFLPHLTKPNARVKFTKDDSPTSRQNIQSHCTAGLAVRDLREGWPNSNLKPCSKTARLLLEGGRLESLLPEPPRKKKEYPTARYLRRGSRE